MDKTLKRLCEAVAYARAHSPFYRARLCAVPRTMAEFACLPFTTAADIAAHGPEMLCIPAANVRRMVTTGTTGPQKRLAFSDADIEATVRFFTAGMRRLCRPGDTVMICFPGDVLDGVGSLLAEALRRFRAVPLVYGHIVDLADAAAFLQAHSPRVLVGPPVPLRALALTAPSRRPRCVLLSADYAAKSVLDTLARVWRCPVYLHYGMTETGLGCAVETPARNGLHVRGDLYIEAVDGELVVTTLCREAMPLIRYRTGDAGALLARGRIGALSGRIEERQKPVPIYALDELLLGCDGVLDFSATYDEGRLTLSVLGDADAARALSPYKNAAVTSAPGLLSDGRRKRGTVRRQR